MMNKIKTHMSRIWNHHDFNTGSMFALASAMLLIVSNLLKATDYKAIEVVMIAAYFFLTNAVTHILSAIINSFIKKKEISANIISIIVCSLVFGCIILRMMNYRPSAGEEAMSIEYAIIMYVAMILGMSSILFNLIIFIFKTIQNRKQKKL